jgi:DNA-binding LacI/PurR family transcriptional regulator
MIGSSCPFPNADRVFTNFYSSARLAVHHLSSSALKHIRLILPKNHDLNTDHLWTAGYVQESRGLQPFYDPMITDDPQEAAEWVNQHPGCGVLGTNRVLTWLQNHGLREHQDFTFISLNVVREPHLAGIREPLLEIGQQAVDVLISKILLNQPGLPEQPVSILMEPYWQEGDIPPHT